MIIRAIVTYSGKRDRKLDKDIVKEMASIGYEGICSDYDDEDEEREICFGKKVK